MKKSKVIKEILLLIVAIFYLSPIYIMLVNSFKNRQELYENVLALPKDFSFQYYIAAIEKNEFFKCLWKFTIYYCRFCYFYRHFIVDDCMDVGKNE